MGPDSQASMDDWRLWQTRIEFNEREVEPSTLRSEGRANSNDFSYVGGGFPDTSAPDGQASYPPDLEPFSEGPEADSTYTQSDSSTSYVGSANFGATPSAYSQPTTPLAPNPTPLSAGGAYLTTEGYNRWRKNENRRNQSRSSGHSSGEYRTAQGSPQSVTTVDEEEGEYSEAIERVATPYFTPSHTPSHRSLATEDPDEETHGDYFGRGPQSPTPWSPHSSHQFQIVQGAIDAVDKKFTEHP